MESKQLSERESKVIRSLRLKKNRDATGLFVAETVKVVEEMLPFFDLELLAMTHPIDLDVAPERTRICTDREMKKISQLEMPSDCLALFRIPEPKPISSLRGLVVGLDEVQNPGNVGTIIRLCDWLGIGTLLLGSGCADPYGAKVVQATAGALGAVRPAYGVDLATLLDGTSLPVIAADLDGIPLGSVTPPEEAVVLFGNEGHGFRPKLKRLCTQTVLIPRAETAVSDSLNVALSAAIILSHFSPTI